MLLLMVFLSIGHALRWQGRRTVTSVGKVRTFSSQLRVVMPITSAEEWDNVMSKAATDRVMIVDFQKSLCKPCKKVAPDFEKLAENYADSVQFFMVAQIAARSARPDEASRHSLRPHVLCLRRVSQRDSVRGAHIELVEDCIVREQIIIDKNTKPGFVDETAELPPDDDTEKAMSRENPGRMESLASETKKAEAKLNNK